MGCLRLVDRWRYKWSSELRVVHGKKAVTSNDWVKRVRSSYFFGMLMPGRHDEISGRTYAYGFNGMERDEEVKGAGNSYDFGARMQDPRLGRFLSVDPLADQRPWVSPYNFVQNNPLTRIDPTGALDSPIYDKNGDFLGTDDKGLQGKAIVMNKDNFTQGMSHEDALKNSLGAGGLSSDAAKTKLLDHYNSLPNRIDYSSDFVLTKEIADKHWQGKSGEGLYVNQANIQLPGVTTESFDNKEGSSFYKNFAWGLSNTGKVYGTLKLTLENANSGIVHIGSEKYLDEYDYSMDGRPLRDFATWLGRPGGANDGKSYFIYGYGKARVPVKK